MVKDNDITTIHVKQLNKDRLMFMAENCSLTIREFADFLIRSHYFNQRQASRKIARDFEAWQENNKNEDG